MNDKKMLASELDFVLEEKRRIQQEGNELEKNILV